MTITTGSLVKGCVVGLPEHLKTAGSNISNVPSVFYVAGNPNNVLQANAGSDIALDSSNGNYYFAKSAGSTWYSMGSTT